MLVFPKVRMGRFEQFRAESSRRSAPASASQPGALWDCSTLAWDACWACGETYQIGGCWRLGRAAGSSRRDLSFISCEVTFRKPYLSHTPEADPASRGSSRSHLFMARNTAMPRFVKRAIDSCQAGSDLAILHSQPTIRNGHRLRSPTRVVYSSRSLSAFPWHAAEHRSHRDVPWSQGADSGLGR